MTQSRVHISPMTAGDYPFALRMTEIEHWGHHRSDIERIHSFEPEGCFIARTDNRRVGMVCTTAYDDYGFLGLLIVRQAARGRKIGLKLMRTAIDYLHGRSVKTIELDGVFRAASLYRRLGFRDKYLSLRFMRPFQQITGRKLTPVSGCLEDVLAFDRVCTGIDRARVLQHLFEEFSESSVLRRKREICGYAAVRSHGKAGCTIGPLVAENTSAAAILLKSVLARQNTGVALMGVPASNPEAAKLALELGFLHKKPSIRMFLGPRRDYERNIYGIASAEKG